MSARPAPSALPYAARATGLVGSVIDSSTSLLHKQTHDIVRFAMGSPAAEAVPARILSAIAAEELSRPAAFDYAATEGDPPLHAALLEMLRGTSDETTADRLTVTAGGMQGLDLFCKIFVDPGDLVVVESPTYTNGSATALSYGAELLEVPVDDDGMIVDDLRERPYGEHQRIARAELPQRRQGIAGEPEQTVRVVVDHHRPPLTGQLQQTLPPVQRQRRAGRVLERRDRVDGLRRSPVEQSR